MSTIFTGTGRCGTAYLARYLTAAGYATQHEALFQPFRDLRDYEPEAVHPESSWCAQYWLDKLPENTRVVHIVRDPRKVYDSFMNREFFTDIAEPTFANTRPWYQHLMRAIDEQVFSKSLSPAERCERWIVGTHERLKNLAKLYIDKPGFHERLEELLDRELVRRDLPPTNSGPTGNHDYPAYIKKLARELCYE